MNLAYVCEVFPCAASLGGVDSGAVAGSSGATFTAALSGAGEGRVGSV